MDREKLIALAERVEAASGPDRELDAKIASLFSNDVESDDGDFWWGPHDQIPQRVPDFTTSLDAAMMLLPDTEFDMTNLYGVARVHVEMGNRYGGHYGSNECGSLPLAFTAAALRALAEGEGE